jgi:hypothetical protein
MKNIFNKLSIQTHYFDYFLNISNDLWFYLYDNLDDENNNIFRQDLRNALTINVNGKYI